MTVGGKHSGKRRREKKAGCKEQRFQQELGCFVGSEWTMDSRPAGDGLGKVISAQKKRVSQAVRVCCTQIRLEMPTNIGHQQQAVTSLGT